MKLIFSPYYDQTLFTGSKNECVLGVKYVGPMGLLNELELRAGLSGKYPGHMDRVMSYCEALDSHGKSCPDKPVYWKSHRADILDTQDAFIFAACK